MISGRGTAPADLSRLPFQLNPRAISLAEGLRAALSVAIFVAAAQLLDQPLLMEAALSALFTCLCDAGGPLRRRGVALGTFGLVGAGLTILLAPLPGLPLWAMLPLAAMALFCTSFARIYGQQALQSGNLLSVAVVLTLDHPHDLGTALGLGAAFLGGNLWALGLTLVIWRLHPYLPARRAVAQAYRSMAALAADLRGLVTHASPEPHHWEAHARVQRRAVREAIEAARQVVMDSARARGPVSPRTAQSLLRLEIADQLFGALIALSDRLETVRAPDALAAADRLLRRLRPLLVVLADAAEHDTVLGKERLQRTIAEIRAAGDALPGGLPHVAEVMVERLHLAATLAAPGNFLPGATVRGTPPSWSQRALPPIRANLTWQSASLRHALRAAVMSVPALALTHIWPTDYGHWLTITLVVTMQPFFAVTWQRAIERIGGTVLGGLIAAALSAFLHGPLMLGAAIFPLTVITFMVRPVHFALMITFLTPTVVLLIEIGTPGGSQLMIALFRALYTMAGGGLAVFGCLVLWPSWEPARLRAEVITAIRAHARYAEAELSLMLDEGAHAAVDQARRAAGLASNNLEASLARSLQEPRLLATPRLQAVMLIDAALRRVAGRLSAMQIDLEAEARCQPAQAWRAWRSWLTDGLMGLAATPPTPLPPRPEGGETETLARIARQLELMDGAVQRLSR